MSKLNLKSVSIIYSSLQIIHNFTITQRFEPHKILLIAFRYGGLYQINSPVNSKELRPISISDVSVAAIVSEFVFS